MENTTLELIVAEFFISHSILAWSMLFVFVIGILALIAVAVTGVVKAVMENRIRNMSVRGFRRRKAELGN